MWKYTNSDELYHYGILGMKWGVRRYQNKDGSLTLAGKIRAKRLQSAIDANDRDVASLKKSGYKSEAKAVKTVGDKNREKLKQLVSDKITGANAKTNHDLRMKTDPVYRQQHSRQPFDEKKTSRQAWDEKPKIDKSKAKGQAFIDKKRASLQKSIDQYIADDPKSVKKGHNWMVDELRYADKKLSELDASKTTVKQVKRIYRYG